MKRTLLTTAVGLTFIGASAQLCLAQPYAQGEGESAQYRQPPEQGPPPGDRDGWSYWRWRHAQRDRYSEPTPGESGPPGPGPGGPPLPPHRPPPPPANAAHFVFQRGPARIDITCPQVFALQDCIQAATQLLDKMSSLRAGGRHPGANDAPGGGSSNPPAGSGGGHSEQPAPNGATTPQLAPANPGGDNRM